MIRYDAIDKIGIPRVYGYGETNYEASIQCEIALREYCLKHFKTGRRLFPKDYKIVKNMIYKPMETDEDRRDRIARDKANIQRVDAQIYKHKK